MKRVLVVCMAAFFLAGCAGEYSEVASVKDFLKKDPDASGAVLAVRQYNRALISSCQRNDMAGLENFTTEREFNKVSHLIQGFIGQGLRMNAELRHMRIEKVERWGPDNVVVTTKELWRYRHVNIKTNGDVKPLTKIEYQMKYNMIRERGRWRLFDLSPE